MRLLGSRRKGGGRDRIPGRWRRRRSLGGGRSRREGAGGGVGGRWGEKMVGCPWCAEGGNGLVWRGRP